MTEAFRRSTSGQPPGEPPFTSIQASRCFAEEGGFRRRWTPRAHLLVQPGEANTGCFVPLGRAVWCCSVTSRSDPQRSPFRVGHSEATSAFYRAPVSPPATREQVTLGESVNSSRSQVLRGLRLRPEMSWVQQPPWRHKGASPSTAKAVCFCNSTENERRPV